MCVGQGLAVGSSSALKRSGICSGGGHLDTISNQIRRRKSNVTLHTRHALIVFCCRARENDHDSRLLASPNEKGEENIKKKDVTASPMTAG